MTSRRLIGSLIGVLALGVLLAIAGELPSKRGPSDDGGEVTADAYLRQGVERERAFDFDAALEAYAKAIRQDPFLLEAHLGYMEAKGWLWRQHELPAEYRALRDRRPESALHRFLYAHAFSRRTLNWRESVALYDEAIELDPAFPWPYAFRYERHTFPEPDDLEEALASLRRCSELAPRLAVCHERRAELADMVEDFETAAEAYERALAATPDGRSRPRMYMGLAESQGMLGRTGEALETLERAFSEFSGGGDVRGEFLLYADLAGRISGAWRHPGWSRESVPPLDGYRGRALRGLEALERSETHPQLQDRIAVWRAQVAIARGEEGTGLDLLTDALADSARFPAPGRTAFLRRRRCEALRDVGRLDAARSDCRAALAAFRVAADSFELRRVLHELLHTEEQLGHFADALDLAGAHLTLSRRNGNDSHAVSALHDLGWIAWRAGDHDLARGALREMADIATSSGRWLYEVGEFYEAIGAYDRALELYHRGARDPRLSAQGRYGNYARSVLGLARVHLLLGDLPRALEFGTEYDDYVSDVGPGHLPFPNLAEIHRARGRPHEAVRHSEAWLAEARRLGSASTEAAARRELALSHAADGHPAEAIAHLRSLLGEHESMDSFRDRGTVLLRLAEAYLATGEADSASAFVERAMDHARIVRDPETRWYAEYLRGRLLGSAGDVEGALAAHERAIDLIEDLFGRVPTDNLRSWFLGRRIAPYEDAIRLHLEAGTAASFREAFRLVERGKAQALLRLVRLGDFEPGARGSRSLLQRKAGLEVRLDAARGRLRAELESADGSASSRVERWGAEVDSLQAIYGELLERIERSSTATGRFSVPPPTPERVRSHLLRADQALLEYTFVEDRLVAFVVSPSGQGAVRLDIEEDEVRRAVDRLRAPFESLKRGELNLAQTVWDLDAASSLYRKVVEPLEGLLEGTEALVIVPVGALWHVPFDALVARRPSRAFPGGVLFQHYEETEFLVDRYAISYAPAAALLDPAVWPDRRRGAGLLIFADPRGARARTSAVDGSADSGARSDGRRAPLPGTRLEAEALAREIDGAAVLLGSEATEEAFRELAPSYGTIHLATHGLVDERMPLYSSLALAPGPDSDGSLHAYELFDATLSADLVVLSACETGVGPVRTGEGMLALSRAFMAAGAPSVVMTHWIVPDEGSLLLPTFYRGLREGRSKAEALRAAKLETKRTRVRAGGRSVSLAHPIYWASYGLVGLPN